MPAIFPPCHIFVEVSLYFLGTEHRPDMLEVLPDGYITCKYEGDECSHHCSPDSNYIVEFKCPVSMNLYYDSRYFLPKCYVPQVTCQIQALNTDKGIFGVLNEDSFTLQFFWKLCPIWNSISDLCTELYGNEIIAKPKICTRIFQN